MIGHVSAQGDVCIVCALSHLFNATGFRGDWKGLTMMKLAMAYKCTENKEALHGMRLLNFGIGIVRD